MEQDRHKYQSAKYGNFNGQTDALCLTSKETNFVFDGICKKVGGACDEDTKECIISEEESQRKMELITNDLWATRPYKEDEYGDEIPYNKQVIDILFAIDSIFTPDSFQFNWNENKFLDIHQEPKHDQANWQSHVANFFWSYYGYKFYYSGVNVYAHTELTNDEIDIIINNDIIKQLCDFIQEKFNISRF